MKIREILAEGILDDIVGDYPDQVKVDTPISTIKTTPRKRHVPRAVYKGEPAKGFKEYVRYAEKDTMHLQDVVNMFAKENKALADNVTINVPVSELDTIKEYDRELINGFTGKNTADEVAAMTADIKKNGIRDPGVVTLNRKKNGTITAILGEGNHRLNIAKKLGLKTMPVRFYYTETFR